MPSSKLNLVSELVGKGCISVALDTSIKLETLRSGKMAVFVPELPWVSSNELCSSTRYIELIGEGGNGEVHRVLYKGKMACMKIDKNSSDMSALKEEAKVMMTLNGAGGAPLVLAISREDPFMIMSYVKGVTMSSLKIADVGPRRWLEIYEELVLKLTEIHSLGIVHCDLKGNNVLVDFGPNGDDLQVHIIDYGLSLHVGEKQSFDDNSVEHFHAQWYAPEVFYGREVSAASDLYSVGIMLRRTFRSLFEKKIIEFISQDVKILTDSLPIYMAKLRPNSRQVLKSLNSAKVEFIKYCQDDTDDLGTF